MNSSEIIIAVSLLTFAVVGGMVDTYASYQFFKPKVSPPRWFSRTFLFWWLVVFVGILPFFMVYTASGFSYWVVKVFVTFGVLETIVWDLVFSKIWSGKWISDSCITWFWIGRHTIGFDKKSIVRFHMFRLVIFAVLFYIFYIKNL